MSTRKTKFLEGRKGIVHQQIQGKLSHQEEFHFTEDRNISTIPSVNKEIIKCDFQAGISSSWSQETERKWECDFYSIYDIVLVNS